MLFDLRSAGRRRTVKGVYLGLALLMFVGFVGFSVGSSGLSGGIVDAITGSKGGGSSDAATKRLIAEANTADRRAAASPSDPALWTNAVQAHIRLAQSGGSDYYNSATGNFTAAGKRQLAQAGDAWNKYVALKPAKPDENIARQMVQGFLAISDVNAAVSTQELITEVDPTQQTFQNLAILAYQAGNTRTGDLAAGKAVDLAPAAQKKSLKSTLDSYKTAALQQQLQQAAPTPTPTVG
jgi:hypothetical protein